MLSLLLLKRVYINILISIRLKYNRHSVSLFSKLVGRYVEHEAVDQITQNKRIKYRATFKFHP